MFNIRSAVITDAPFIYSSWLKGFRFGSDAKKIDSTLYYERRRNVITDLIGRSTVNVCCLTEDPDVILGYIVFEGQTLHWVFTKTDWRHQGIARSLLPPNIKFFTHLTRLGEDLWHSKHPTLLHDPI